MTQGVKTSRQSEPRKRRMRVRPAYLVLAIVMGFFAYKFVVKTQELQRLSHEANVLRTENQKTNADILRTQRAIKYFRSPGYIEEQARATFAYTLPGDVPILVKPSQPSGATVRAAPVVYVAPKPTWKQWWDSFF